MAIGHHVEFLKA